MPSLPFMAHHWTPMSQVERSFEPGEWFMTDRGRTIAVLRETTVMLAGKKYELLRSVTYAKKSEDRVLPRGSTSARGRGHLERVGEGRSANLEQAMTERQSLLLTSTTTPKCDPTSPV